MNHMFIREKNMSKKIFILNFYIAPAKQENFYIKFALFKTQTLFWWLISQSDWCKTSQKARTALSHELLHQLEIVQFFLLLFNMKTKITNKNNQQIWASASSENSLNYFKRISSTKKAICYGKCWKISFPTVTAVTFYGMCSQVSTSIFRIK